MSGRLRASSISSSATVISSSWKVPSERRKRSMGARSGGASLRKCILVTLPSDLADATDELWERHPAGAGGAGHPGVRADVAVRVDVDHVRRAVLRHAEVDP